MKRLHSHGLLLFGTLSLADLLLTVHLMDGTGPRVYEGNPLANACLAAHGLVGLAVYKLAAVSITAGMLAGLCCHRPVVGGRLLVFACGTVGLVVVYSGVLAVVVGRPVRSTPIQRVYRYDQAPWPAMERLPVRAGSAETLAVSGGQRP